MKSPRSYFVVLLLLACAGGLIFIWIQRNQPAPSRTRATYTSERTEPTNRESRDRSANAPTASNDAAPRAVVREAAVEPVQMVNPPPPQPDAPAAAAQRRLAAEQRYGGFIRSLGWPPAETERLLVLLAAHMNIRHDVLTAARDQGVDLSSNPDGLVQLQIASQNEILQSLQALLGDDGIARLRAYERNQPLRTLVSQLQQRLAGSDAPLTLAQADQLADVLASNKAEQLMLSPFDTSTSMNPIMPVGSRIMRPGGRVDITGAATPSRVNTDPGPLATVAPPSTIVSGPAISDAAIAQARGFLSSGQLAALQQMQVQQAAQNRR